MALRTVFSKSSFLIHAPPSPVRILTPFLFFTLPSEPKCSSSRCVQTAAAEWAPPSFPGQGSLAWKGLFTLHGGQHGYQFSPGEGDLVLDVAHQPWASQTQVSARCLAPSAHGVLPTDFLEARQAMPQGATRSSGCSLSVEPAWPLASEKSQGPSLLWGKGC